MKTKRRFIIVMLGITLFYLNIDAQQLLPVRKDSISKWSVIDSKGRMYPSVKFDYISESGEGTFAVKNGNTTWSVYALSNKKPRLIADSLARLGNFSEGAMAVIRKHGDCPIEIIDMQGKTLLTLDSICGKMIVRCGYCHYGRFVVTTVDNNGVVKEGMIDKQGKVVIEPVYEELYACADGQVCGRRLSKDKKHFEIVIPDGRGGFSLQSTDKGSYRIGHYAIFPVEGATLVFDLAGSKDKFSLPANSIVTDVCGDLVAYKKKSANGDFVYNCVTKQTMSFEDSQHLTLTKKGLLSVNFDDEVGVSLFSLKGKFIRKIGWQYVEKYGDYVIAIRVDDNNIRVNLLGKNFNPVLKNDCAEFSYFAEPGYEYRPARILNSQFVCSLMIDNLRIMVDSGAVAGRSIENCHFESKVIYDLNIARDIIDCFKVEKDGIITKAGIEFLVSLDNTINVGYLDYYHSAIKTKMDELFKKVADDVYEDNGVFYHVKQIEETIIISISNSPEKTIVLP